MLFSAKDLLVWSAV